MGTLLIQEADGLNHFQRECAIPVMAERRLFRFLCVGSFVVGPSLERAAAEIGCDVGLGAGEGVGVTMESMGVSES